MQDDFDDGGMGLPDDEMTGGSELPDLDIGGEGEIDLDAEHGDEPGGRLSGGARARASAGRRRKAAGSPKAAGSRKSAAKRGGAKKPAGKKKGAASAARTGSRAAARKGSSKKKAGAKKGEKAGATKGGAKKGGARKRRREEEKGRPPVAYRSPRPGLWEPSAQYSTFGSQVSQPVTHSRNALSTVLGATLERPVVHVRCWRAGRASLLSLERRPPSAAESCSVRDSPDGTRSAVAVFRFRAFLIK